MRSKIALNLTDVPQSARSATPQSQHSSRLFSNNHVSLDISPPKFSGDNDSTDFYTFKSSFEEFCSVKNLNDQESLLVMKNKCLKGAPLKSCEDLDNIVEIWQLLKKLYGDPRKLVANKIGKVLALGKCPLAADKG